MKFAATGWALLLIWWGFVSGCGGAESREAVYRMKLETAGEVVVGQASAGLHMIRSYWTIAEYAKASGTDYATAAKEMQTSQTTETLRMMEQNKSEIDRMLEGLQDPPDRYAATLSLLEELYDAYLSIHEFALDPPEEALQDLSRAVSSLEGRLQESKAALDKGLHDAALRQE